MSAPPRNSWRPPRIESLARHAELRELAVEPVLEVPPGGSAVQRFALGVRVIDPGQEFDPPRQQWDESLGINRFLLTQLRDPACDSASAVALVPAGPTDDG